MLLSLVPFKNTVATLNVTISSLNAFARHNKVHSLMYFEKGAKFPLSLSLDNLLQYLSSYMYIY